MSEGIPHRSQGGLKVASGFSAFSRRIVRPLLLWGHRDAYGGGLMIGAGLVALAIANLGLHDWYKSFLEQRGALVFGEIEFSRTLHHWINDALMAVFFFIAALELKEEIAEGSLSTWKRASVPLSSALCGMLFPVGIYFSIVSSGGGEAMKGWGIPMATDIAFALVILALLGKGLPRGIRVFLLALAIIDDAGAILVVAVFYSDSISWMALGVAAGICLLLHGLSRLGVKRLIWYAGLGIPLWFAVAVSGVHATIAGVVFGLLIPHRPGVTHKDAARELKSSAKSMEDAASRGDTDTVERAAGRASANASYSESPLSASYRAFRPFVYLLVLPVFAFANAGVEVTGAVVKEATSSVLFYGVFFGLVVGKPLGILFGAWLPKTLGWGELPESATLKHILGCGFLGGIGFTVSLFIAGLAFESGNQNDIARLAILVASVGSALLAWLYFFVAVRKKS